MNHQESRQEYLKRIHHLQNHLEANMYDTYTIEELAAIAGFSKYHFHRIFKAMCNESIFQFITRIKLEAIASTLVSRSDLSITDIAYLFKFSDSAVFSRTFKQFYDISPREFRNKYSNNCKVSSLKTIYTKHVNSDVKATVEVITMDAIPVIYLRKTGAYKQLETCFATSLDSLFAFAIEHDLLDEQSSPIAVYHSHPDFSDEEKQRTSICLRIKEPITLLNDSDIMSMSIQSGTYAVAHFEIDQSEYGDAWKYVYGEWLPQSGYLPISLSPFEVYVNNPNEHPQHKHMVDIYMPVEPLF